MKQHNIVVLGRVEMLLVGDGYHTSPPSCHVYALAASVLSCTRSLAISIFSLQFRMLVRHFSCRPPSYLSTVTAVLFFSSSTYLVLFVCNTLCHGYLHPNTNTCKSAPTSHRRQPLATSAEVKEPSGAGHRRQTPRFRAIRLRRYSP